MSIKTIQHSLHSLKSEIIGELDGANGLAYFRGIPYASLEKRWTNSLVSHSLNASSFNAVEFGPRCVQKEGPIMVTGGTNDATPGDDEFTCLNLNISSPTEVLVDKKDRKTAKLLPVMVWIHGGGWSFGANSVGRYRAAALCELAKQTGNEMVLVQINYRLGPLGFAASDDLESEQTPAQPLNEHHNSGYHNGKTETHKSGNYGLVDQINALQWVQDHIQDFGGDPACVTAFGISAGSGSIHFQILAGNPLFDRAILMSGEGAISPERLQKLRAMDPLELTENYPSGAMGAVLDGTLLPKSWSLFDAQPPTRCKRFYEVVKSVFSATNAEAFRKHFGFTSEDLPFKAYRDAMRFFLSVLMFQYQNENSSEVFSAEDRQVALDMGRIWTAFACGKEPWEPYGKSGSFMRLGPSGESKLVDLQSDGTRDYRYLGWLRDHFEETKKLAQDLMRAP